MKCWRNHAAFPSPQRNCQPFASHLAATHTQSHFHLLKKAVATLARTLPSFFSTVLDQIVKLFTPLWRPTEALPVLSLGSSSECTGVLISP